MSQRKLLLPPFHGESVRRYAEVMAEATAREVDTWPVGRAVRAAPADAGDHARGDPARGVRRARRGAAWTCSAQRIPRLAETSSVLSWLPFMERDLGGLSPAARFRKALAAVDELIYEEIADRGASRSRSATTCSRCCSRPATRTAARCPTSSCATS